MLQYIQKKMICRMAGAMLLCALLLGVPTAVWAEGKHTAKSQPTKSPYSERYTANPDASIGGRGIGGNWAAFSGVAGNTGHEQLDEKIAYIEALYRERKERFVIEEGISLEQVNDVAGIAYLYEQSEIYRLLVAAGDKLPILSRRSFGRSTGTEVPALYDRYVFHLEGAATLRLEIDYNLKEGELAVWIVSPTGEFLHQMPSTQTHSNTIELELSPGLYSVVLAYELDGGHASGELMVEGNFIY